jgi:hypothetical protein
MMKKLLTAALGAVPGMLIGVVVWTVLATVVLIVWLLGYHVLYLGVLCTPPGGRGIGLGWCAAPDPATREAVGHWSMLLTAFAFTWGEILAAVAGGFLGGTTLVALVSLMKRVLRPRQGGPAVSTPAPADGRPAADAASAVEKSCRGLPPERQ